jgi:hypothetical protein
MKQSKYLSLFGDAGEASAWYLAGGVDPANCIAAYQAKGAASYAASKVNLANPGTWDLSEIIAPTWNALTGWTFDGATTLLDTGLTLTQIPQLTSSFTGKYANVPTSDGTKSVIGGQYADLEGTTYPTNSIEINYNGLSGLWLVNCSNWDEGTGNNNGVWTNIDPEIIDISNGVLFRAGEGIYFNGELKASGNAANAGAVNIPSMTIGAINFYEEEAPANSPYYYFSGDIHAVALYNTALTAEQVSAITTAMQAL